MEGDATKADRARKESLFQSTPSVWRETTVQSAERNIITISIHSLRVEGDQLETETIFTNRISIHSLRVEGDWTREDVTTYDGISIHSLRVEGDI